MGKSLGDRRRGAGLARREEGAYLLVRDRRATQTDRMDRRRGRLTYPFAVPNLMLNFSRAAPVLHALLLSVLIAGCSQSASTTDTSSHTPPKNPQATFLDKEYPLHGRVTGVQLTIRRDPDPQSHGVGWLRMGSAVRLKPHSRASSTCASGWYSIFPQGWICKGEGVKISSNPVADAFAINPPPRNAALPYAYHKVRETSVEYYRPPSRDEQRAAQRYVEQYNTLKAKSALAAERFVSGKLTGQPIKPAVVHRLLERGSYIAGAGVETRARRDFVRTVTGRYLKRATLIPITGSSFAGQPITSTNPLPVAWAIRTGHRLKKHQQPDGTVRFIKDTTQDAIGRHASLPWAGRQHHNGIGYHELKDGSFLKDWFVAVAELISPPRNLAASQVWIHVDISQQTLVVYRGKQPLYATLVSTGLTGYDTPLGEFTIREKRVADTMANLGSDIEDRYSIEDVPWTQYLKGSIAIHGTFWHSRFGLRHSHGCINLSPLDAHAVFNYTEPSLPLGWHGIIVQAAGHKGTLVWITE